MSLAQQLLVPTFLKNPWYDPDSSGLMPYGAHQAKKATNLTASLLDLGTNGNHLSIGVTSGWDSVNGWVFNGTNQHLDTTFVPQNDQSQSLMLQVTGVTTGGAWAGTFDGATQAFLIMNLVGAGYWANGGITVTPGSALSGNLAIAGNTAYLDGIPIGGTIPTWGGAATSNLWIGCANQGGVVLYPVTANIQAIALWDTVLTNDQVAARATAMAAL